MISQPVELGKGDLKPAGQARLQPGVERSGAPGRLGGSSAESAAACLQARLKRRYETNVLLDGLKLLF